MRRSDVDAVDLHRVAPGRGSAQRQSRVSARDARLEQQCALGAVHRQPLHELAWRAAARRRRSGGIGRSRVDGGGRGEPLLRAERRRGEQDEAGRCEGGTPDNHDGIRGGE